MSLSVFASAPVPAPCNNIVALAVANSALRVSLFLHLEPSRPSSISYYFLPLLFDHGTSSL